MTIEMHFLQGGGQSPNLDCSGLLVPSGSLDAKRVLEVLEGFGCGCHNPGILLALGAHCFGVGAPLKAFGRPAQMDELNAVRAGTVVAGLAVTESEAGSDPMSMTTRYRAEGDNYILNGAKCYITNVAEADMFLVLATKDPRLHFRGVSAFLVHQDASGVVPGMNERRLSVRGCSIGTLALNDVVIPRSALVGKAGGGAAVFGLAMMWERSLIGAMQLGVIRRQLLSSLSHVKTRQQFGRPIGANQYVANRIVGMVSKYMTSRLLIENTLSQLAKNTLTPGLASLTKLYVSEAALACSTEALRLQGGAGLMGSQASSEVHDALAGTIYSGTSGSAEGNHSIDLGVDAVTTPQMNLSELACSTADRYPHRTALITPSGSINYEQLRDLTLRLASYIVASGLHSGDRVAICLPKSPELSIAIFGVLSSGCCYVPIDYATPRKRIEFILSNSQARMFICTGRIARNSTHHIPDNLSEHDTITDRDVLIIAVNGDDDGQNISFSEILSWGKCLASKRLRCPVIVDPRSTAYILYTSGSTGEPKGVVHSHKSAMTFVKWASDAVSLSHSDIVSQHSSPTFDLSVFDFFCSAMVGATLVSVPEWLFGNAARTYRFIVKTGITVWYSVPSGIAPAARPGEV